MSLFHFESVRYKIKLAQKHKQQQRRKSFTGKQKYFAKIDSKVKFRMKRAGRRPYKPWFKKRKPSGRVFNRSTNDLQNGERKSEENLEIFVGYHKKNDDIDENEEEDSRTIEFYAEERCPYVAWKLYFPNKSKCFNEI